jgi:hypothetical protein
MTNKTSAIHAALPAIPPKPRIAATIAMIRNTTAHFNNAVTPLGLYGTLENHRYQSIQGSAAHSCIRLPHLAFRGSAGGSDNTGLLAVIELDEKDQNRASISALEEAHGGHRINGINDYDCICGLNREVNECG